LVLGDHLLAEGVLEEAATAAKRALALCGSCPTAQALLYRVYRAQEERGIPVEHSDVALYDLKDYFCSKPFDTLTTVGGGDATLCDCGGWLPFYAGNALTADSIDAVWNSEVSVEIRRSILDGDFSYCSRMLCPAIVGRTLPKKSEVSDPAMRGYIERGTVQLVEGPRLVQLSHDATCNLACPSCRSGIIVATSVERSTYAAALDRFIFPLLRKVNGSVLITGWGDPFSSQHYRAILAYALPQARRSYAVRGMIHCHFLSSFLTCRSDLSVGNFTQQRPDSTHARKKKPASLDYLHPSTVTFPTNKYFLSCCFFNRHRARTVIQVN
jgi:hypothetical protein